MNSLILGDCRDAMASMEENSVDAIVTDPPYGLEFMGKEWDAPWKGKAKNEFNEIDKGSLGGFTKLPNNSRVNNVQCSSCGKWKFSSNPCVCDSPQFPNARLMAMVEFQEWFTDISKEMIRVLKPGGYLLAFSGSRTYHRLACAIEDAGFEVRDQIMYVYGSGFPKSHNLHGDHEGWGTALKPAHEPICVARKPLVGTVAENVQKFGTGALNIDGCRVDKGGDSVVRPPIRREDNQVLGSGLGVGKQEEKMGRWPANLIHDGSEEVTSLFPTSKSTIDRSSHAGRAGTSTFAGENQVERVQRGDSGSAARFFYHAKEKRSERWSYLTCDCEAPTIEQWESVDQSHRGKTDSTSPEKATCGVDSMDDSGSSTPSSGSESMEISPQDSSSTISTETSMTTDSATSSSSALPSTSEFTQGVNLETETGTSRASSAVEPFESTPVISTSPKRVGLCTGVVVDATSPLWSGKSVCVRCGAEVKRTAHPTQKPVDLMRWLCRLVTPPGGTVLDPFTGSGSTGKAAILEGFDFIGIEKEQEYLEIATARIAAAEKSMKSKLV